MAYHYTRAVEVALLLGLLMTPPKGESGLNDNRCFTPAAQIETYRREQNQRSQTSGDRYLFDYPAQVEGCILADGLQAEDLEGMIANARDLFHFPAAPDLRPLYQQVGLTLLQTVADHSQKLDPETRQRLTKEGLEAASSSSFWQKTIRCLADFNFGYLKSKVKDLFYLALFTLEGDSAVREENQGALIGVQDFELTSEDIDVKRYYFNDRLIFYATRFHHSRIGVNYEINIESGISEQDLADTYGSNLLLFSLATYTAGSNKPASLVVDEGKIKNFLLSKADGLLFVSPQKVARIVDRQDFHDLSSEISSGGTSIYEDLREATSQPIDLFQTHLIRYNGRNIVPIRTSRKVAKRRAFVEYDDGYSGIVSTPEETRLSIYEFAELLGQLGVKSALNLDTGYNDFSGMVTDEGTLYFGKEGKNRTNNLLVVYKR